ncbi:unnamed protein product [Merluccius merluccius]
MIVRFDCSRPHMYVLGLRRTCPLPKDEEVRLSALLWPGTSGRVAPEPSLSSMSHATLFLMLCKTGLRGKLQTFAGKMVNTVYRDEETGVQDREGKEESILALLGIVGTILNLVVIIFVYIYTTL